MMDNIQSIIEDLLQYVESSDYAGYDPYDALNSSLIRKISSRSKIARIAFTQLIRRSPINFRKLLGIKKGHNPKAIGLFLSSYSKLYSIFGDQSYLDRIGYLLDLLERLSSSGYSGKCWGYNFDWQSRTFFRPKGTPTIVNTSFIGHSLLDCYELTGKENALQMTLTIKDFILNDLNRTYQDDMFCFSYTPVDTSVVHNANMLGASLLIRMNKYQPDENVVSEALASMAYSMSLQKDDGSWYYADTHNQQWKDSFHTGFNLHALRYILYEGYGQQWKSQYELGIEYYARNFFLNDGTPKYYNDNVYPIDIHAPAEAIYFFSGMGNKFNDLTNNILGWMILNMRHHSGYYYFRKNKNFINKISYMRWAQAWVLFALAEYFYNFSEKSCKEKREICNGIA